MGGLRFEEIGALLFHCDYWRFPDFLHCVLRPSVSTTVSNCLCLASSAELTLNMTTWVQIELGRLGLFCGDGSGGLEVRRVGAQVFRCSVLRGLSVLGFGGRFLAL